MRYLCESRRPSARLSNIIYVVYGVLQVVLFLQWMPPISVSVRNRCKMCRLQAQSGFLVVNDIMFQYLRSVNTKVFTIQTSRFLHYLTVTVTANTKTKVPISIIFVEKFNLLQSRPTCDSGLQVDIVKNRLKHWRKQENFKKVFVSVGFTVEIMTDKQLGLWEILCNLCILRTHACPALHICGAEDAKEKSKRKCSANGPYS